MKRAVGICCTLMLCLGLCACTGGTNEDPQGSTAAPVPESTAPATSEAAGGGPEAESPSPMEMIESGWSVGGSGYVSYGVGIRNPNTSFEAEFPKITITGKDSEGKIVFSDEQVLMFMLPGAEYYFGGQAGNGTAPETVEFSVSVSKDDWIPNDKQSMAIYEITNINDVKGEYGDVDFTGEITTLEEWDDVSQTCVNVILRDESGEIIGGSYGFVDTPAKGETAPFAINEYGAPDYSSYEIYAQPW